MAVTLTVEMAPEEEASLLEFAKAQGVSVESLLRRAVLQIVSTAPGAAPREHAEAEELDRAFEEIADMNPGGIPALPPDALSRESIYTRDGE